MEEVVTHIAQDLTPLPSCRLPPFGESPHRTPYSLFPVNQLYEPYSQKYRRTDVSFSPAMTTSEAGPPVFACLVEEVPPEEEVIADPSIQSGTVRPPWVEVARVRHRPICWVRPRLELTTDKGLDKLLISAEGPFAGMQVKL